MYMNGVQVHMHHMSVHYEYAYKLAGLIIMCTYSFYFDFSDISNSSVWICTYTHTVHLFLVRMLICRHKIQ